MDVKHQVYYVRSTRPWFHALLGEKVVDTRATQIWCCWVIKWWKMMMWGFMSSDVGLTLKIVEWEPNNLGVAGWYNGGKESHTILVLFGDKWWVWELHNLGVVGWRNSEHANHTTLVLGDKIVYTKATQPWCCWVTKWWIWEPHNLGVVGW